MTLKDQIKAEAYRLGFSLCGITTLETPAGFNKYKDWLSKGFHADMAYLTSEYHREIRRRPDLLVPGSRSIISLGWKYPLRSMESLENSENAWLAGYTNTIDYHLHLPKLLEKLKSFTQQIVTKPIQARAFTDSAPILEREIAARAGLGWIGKNSCLISPKIGSGFILAELFTDLELDPDQPFTSDHCGSCHRCLDACPTECIQPDRTIDANKCISYLTIENKKSIPRSIRSEIGKWLFGCDICQMVCPWNQKSLQHLIDFDNLTWTMEKVFSILSITSQEFRKDFGDTSISRSKLLGMQRNVLVWLGNNGGMESVSVISQFQKTTSESLLMETSQWAKDEIKSRNL